MGTQRARRPQLLAITLTIGLAGAVMGGHTISHIIPFFESEVLGVGLCTAILSAAMAWFVVRGASTGKKAASACFGATVIAAVTNSPLSFMVVFLSGNNSFDFIGLMGGMVAATIVGAFITVPLGIGFAVPYTILVGMTHRFSRDRSYEAFEWTLLVCGIWLAGVGLFCAISGIALLSDLSFMNAMTSPITLLALSLEIFGVVVLGYAGCRLFIRRRWVARLRLGEVSGLCLVAIDEIMARTDHIRPLLTTNSSPAAVVVRRRQGVANGAYRTGELFEPVALL